MTQWFLEKALLGSPEQGLGVGAWGEGLGWGGDQWDSDLLGNPLERGGGGLFCRRVLVLPASPRYSPKIPFMKEMEHLPLCSVHLGW